MHPDPIHIDGWGLTVRELRWAPGGALGRLVIGYAPELDIAEDELGYLARARDGRIGLVITGDQDTRATSYKHLHAAGWRYRGEHYTLHGARCWWAPVETANAP